MLPDTGLAIKPLLHLVTLDWEELGGKQGLSSKTCFHLTFAGVFGVSQDTSAYQSIDTPGPPSPYPNMAGKGAPPPSY